jgi:hypothetical protein
VVFPAGVYRIGTTLSVAVANITFVGMAAATPGAGTSAGKTEIRMDSAASAVVQLGVSSSLTAVGLCFANAQSNSASVIDATAVTSGTLNLYGCQLGGASSSGHVVELGAGMTVVLRDCDLTLGAGTGSAIYATATSGISLQLDACTFTGAATAYTGAGLVYASGIRARGCTFAPSHTSGTMTCVGFNTGTGLLDGSVIGCSFGLGTAGADTIGIALDHPSAASTFVEAGNRFPNATQYDSTSFTAYSYTVDAATTTILLQTRESRTIVINSNTSPLTVPTDQYGTVIVRSNNTAHELDGDRPPAGARGRVIFYRITSGGGAGSCTLDLHFFGDTVATTADTSTHYWEYICCTVNATLRMMITVDARSVGNGA